MFLATIFWTGAGFLLGAIPFSPLIGRLALRRDIQEVGDKNPGATNVLRTGGFLWFTLALILDITKGALPVGLAYHVFGLQGWAAIPIALAPSLGHAFSPFLGWRGGKAIAATFGVWIGLTIWTMPLFSLVGLTIFTLLFAPSGWAVMFILGAMFLALALWFQDPVLVGVVVLQTILLAWTHREDLQQRPRLRFLGSRPDSS